MALREGKTQPTFEHFAKARIVVIFGEDPQRQEDSLQQHVTAVHEAGHAVVAVLHQLPFVQVTVQGMGSMAGFLETMEWSGCATACEIEHLIDLYLGGRAADELLAEPSDGALTDLEQATRLAANMIRGGLVKGNVMVVPGENVKEFALRHCKEIEDILQERMKIVRQLLQEHRAFLDAVAEALESRKYLFEEDVLSIQAKAEV